MNRTCKLGLVGALAVLTAVALPQTAGAEEHFTHHVFHERDVRHFRGPELEIWRGGHWHHEWHDGRFGWWWFAGGVWYFYDNPVYPYPLTVSETVIVEPTTPPPQPGAPAYYYCDNPAGYYPAVTNCSVPFRAVPMTPPGYAPPPGAAIPPPSGH